MRRITERLRTRRGETLVETLAAILVAALSVGLLLTCVTAADRINRSARAADDDFYQQLDAAEGRTGAGGSITVDITGENGFTASIPAALYGGEALRAYVRAEGGVGP